jgi:hypothetical protein
MFARVLGKKRGLKSVAIPFALYTERFHADGNVGNPGELRGLSYLCSKLNVGEKRDIQLP